MVNIKRLLLIMLTSIITFSLSGCWNYRGLNELVIISGIAIDKDYKNGTYKINFEVLSLASSGEENKSKTKYIESEGETIFDAIRNARKKTAGKLYFGNTQIIVVSQELAKKEKLSVYMDLFIRDSEFRETSSLIISQGQTAKEIFSSKPLDMNILSYQIETAINNDNKTTSSTINREIYEIYNNTKSEGCELAIPAIRLAESNNEVVSELNGSAVFKDEKLIGFLTPDETKYLLMVNGKMKGGIITILNSENGGAAISLEIVSNHSNVDVAYINDKIQITVNNSTEAFLGENISEVEYPSDDDLKRLETVAKNEIKDRLNNIIQKAQTEYKSDFFCFGNILYKTKQKQWEQVSDRWDELFCDADIIINTDIYIRNTAQITNS